MRGTSSDSKACGASTAATIPRDLVFWYSFRENDQSLVGGGRTMKRAPKKSRFSESPCRPVESIERCTFLDMIQRIMSIEMSSEGGNSNNLLAAR